MSVRPSVTCPSSVTVHFRISTPPRPPQLLGSAPRHPPCCISSLSRSVRKRVHHSAQAAEVTLLPELHRPPIGCNRGARYLHPTRPDGGCSCCSIHNSRRREVHGCLNPGLGLHCQITCNHKNCQSCKIIDHRQRPKACLLPGPELRLGCNHIQM